jgi:sterol desaturase/sphingolipid hydroxylase (fatty acid hydroxylase superfamily)
LYNQLVLTWLEITGRGELLTKGAGVSGLEVFLKAHHHFFHFLLRPLVFYYFLFLARIVFFTPLELIWTARKIPYLQVIGKDFGAFVILRHAVMSMAMYLNRFIVPGGYHFPVQATIAHLPLGARVLLFFILGDLGHYWIHRLTHTRYFWRVHKWHRDPTYMYWFAGIRSFALDIAMVNIPYILIFPLLDLSPGWLGIAITVAYILITDWMHLNVPWGLKWVEWIVVTPRYHHIHHSDNPDHFLKNLAPVFPVWDRLFGTYLDPDEVGADLSFGTGEKTNPARLIFGI